MQVESRNDLRQSLLCVHFYNKTENTLQVFILVIILMGNLKVCCSNIISQEIYHSLALSVESLTQYFIQISKYICSFLCFPLGINSLKLASLY